MSASLNSVGAITLFVEDPQRSKSFYQAVFEVSAIYEDSDAVAFGFENTIVNLLKLPAARELIDPGAVAGRLRTASFTDPDGHIWEIAEKLPEAHGK